MRAAGRVAAFLATALFAVAGHTADRPFDPIPPEQVRAGQRGIAWTVFEGTEPQPFELEVLGVARNGLGPGRDLIIARLVGERVERTGVVAGMSGSPVFIDGRLAGALAYRLGVFTRDPIAGITPFAYMDAIPRDAAHSPGTAAAAGLPTEEALSALLGEPAGTLLPPPASAGAGPEGAQALPTPILISGGAGALLEFLSPVLERSGWLSLAGGSGSSGAPAPAGAAALQPGDAVGAQLMRGDLGLAALGTVTQVDGDRVWAFGHPFVRSGMTRIPMTRFEVIATIASELNSYKLGNVGEPVGVFEQDRFSGIAGRLGDSPPLVPLQVRLHAPGHEPVERRFEMIDHPQWSPFLAQAAVLNSLLVDPSYGEQMTLRVAAELRLAGLPEIHFHETYTGIAPSQPPVVSASSDVGRLVAAIAANRFEDVPLEGASIDIEIEERTRYVTLETVRAERTRVRPGEEIRLQVDLVPYRGDRRTEWLAVQVPAETAPGPLHLLVGGAATLDRLEAPVIQARLRQMDRVAAIADWIGELRRSDRIYVKGTRGALGAVVGAKLMPDLPMSVWTVLSHDRSSGAFAPVVTKDVLERSFPVESVVLGGHLLALEVVPPAAREDRP